MNISGGLSVGFVEFAVGSFSWEKLVEVVVLGLKGLQVREEFFVFGFDEGNYLILCEVPWPGRLFLAVLPALFMKFTMFSAMLYSTMQSTGKAKSRPLEAKSLQIIILVYPEENYLRELALYSVLS